MSRARLIFLILALLVVAAVIFLGLEYRRARDARRALFDEVAPVTLANCEIARYGDAHDGGYLVCRNLIGRAQAAYSYGINGTDEWGCQVARERSIPLHQYDCFNTTVPPCAGVNAFFYAACVGPRTETIDGRSFGTMSEQIAKNGDGGKPLLVKMDVEGSEWASLHEAPDSVLRDIDQLVVEFHGIEDPRFAVTIRRLKQWFYVANVHINNYSCVGGLDPFRGSVFEVLMVNKQIAELAQTTRTRWHHALDAPNEPRMPDCQDGPAVTSQVELLRTWFRRFGRRVVFGPQFATP